MLELEREIERLGPWFHNLHLPDGTQTCPEHPLGDFPSFKWHEIGAALPADLTGCTALDIGCNAGFYSFELARRGAQVTALDVDPHYLAQARFAAQKFGLEHRVEFQQRHLYELARSVGKWDVVLFLGVLYHLRYPLLGLDIVSRCVGRYLVFQSLSMPDHEPTETPHDIALEQRECLNQPAWPKMAFIEHRLAGDVTNWWAPNQACIEAMLRSSGLRVLSRPAHETVIATPDPSLESNMWSWNEDEFLSAVGVADSETDSER